MSLKVKVIDAGFDYTRKCKHNHQLNGSGAVFFQSLGILRCGICGGFQAIKKPLD